MQTNRVPRLLAAVASCALVCWLSSSSSVLAVPVQVDFSGANGEQFTVTIPQPITYNVTNNTPNTGIVFVFRDVGTIFGPTFISGPNGNGSTIGYTVDGGPFTLVDRVGNRSNVGTLDSDDLLLLANNSTDAIALDDTIVLSAGTLTSQVSTNSAVPASGLYEAMIVDRQGLQLGSAVPEPAGLTALALSAGTALLRRRPQ